MWEYCYLTLIADVDASHVFVPFYVRNTIKISYIEGDGLRDVIIYRNDPLLKVLSDIFEENRDYLKYVGGLDDNSSDDYQQAERELAYGEMVQEAISTKISSWINDSPRIAINTFYKYIHDLGKAGWEVVSAYEVLDPLTVEDDELVTRDGRYVNELKKFLLKRRRDIAEVATNPMFEPYHEPKIEDLTLPTEFKTQANMNEDDYRNNAFPESRKYMPGDGDAIHADENRDNPFRDFD